MIRPTTSDIVNSSRRHIASPTDSIIDAQSILFNNWAVEVQGTPLARCPLLQDFGRSRSGRCCGLTIVDGRHCCFPLANERDLMSHSLPLTLHITPSM